MIEQMLIGVGIFAAGLLVGYELHRKARSGHPAIGPFKKKKAKSMPKQRVHPGEYPV